MKLRDFFSDNDEKGRLTTLVSDISRRLSPALLIYWAALLICVFVFARLAEDIYARQTFRFDELILEFFANHHRRPLTIFFVVLTYIGSGYGIAILTTIGILISLKYKSYSSALLLGVGVGGAALFTHLSKPFFTRHRPALFPSLIPVPSDYSFPSGHATQSAALAICVYLIASHHKCEWKIPVALMTFSFALLVGLSRVYLQVHFPSDVIGGFTLAISWVLGLSACLKWHHKYPTE